MHAPAPCGVVAAHSALTSRATACLVGSVNAAAVRTDASFGLTTCTNTDLRVNVPNFALVEASKRLLHACTQPMMMVLDWAGRTNGEWEDGGGRER